MDEQDKKAEAEKKKSGKKRKKIDKGLTDF
jgi:hypothetical protein